MLTLIVTGGRIRGIWWGLGKRLDQNLQTVIPDGSESNTCLGNNDSEKITSHIIIVLASIPYVLQQATSTLQSLTKLHAHYYSNLLAYSKIYLKKTFWKYFLERKKKECEIAVRLSFFFFGSCEILFFLAQGQSWMSFFGVLCLLMMDLLSWLMLFLMWVLQIREARNKTLQECLRTEYRLTINALCGTISKDLYEVCFTSLSLSLSLNQMRRTRWEPTMERAVSSLSRKELAGIGQVYMKPWLTGSFPLSQKELVGNGWVCVDPWWAVLPKTKLQRTGFDP